MSSSDNSKSFPPVRACIFDVDGLLINSEDIYSIAMNRILHEYGRPGIPWSVKAQQQSRGIQGYLRLLEWAKIPLSPLEFKTKVAAHHDLFRESQALPGVIELIGNLSKRTSPQVHVAIASSAGRALFDIKTSHLPEIFTFVPEERRIFGTDEAMVGKTGKPAPDIFLLALQRINEAMGSSEIPVKPEECLVFEDSTAGVQAGRGAGMRVCWIPHPQLLNVFCGCEEVVFSGATDKFHADMLSAADSAAAVNKNPLLQNLDPADASRISQDGWSERLSSLENFPYERYGLHLTDEGITNTKVS